MSRNKAAHPQMQQHGPAPSFLGQLLAGCRIALCCAGHLINADLHELSPAPFAVDYIPVMHQTPDLFQQQQFLQRQKVVQTLAYLQKLAGLSTNIPCNDNVPGIS